MTDKADRENHEIGLANIKSTAAKSDVSVMSFKDMWQARYPGAYYNAGKDQFHYRQEGHCCTAGTGRKDEE